MIKKIQLIIITFLFFILNFTYANQTNQKNRYLEIQLERAEQEISRGAYDNALKLLTEYRKVSKRYKKRPLLSFYVIESIGRIYLRIKQDPDAAIKFFSEALEDKNLSDSEFDIIRAWLGRAREWKDLGILPKNINDPKKLFELGKKYYEQGIKSQKYTMDLSASADFSLASNYLIPFTIYYDNDPNIGPALYMMGEIRRRSWHNNDYWVENFYLMEVIRRFPHTELALKAYNALYEDVHFGYTGSSGDNTPESWNVLLKEFKKLSELKTPTAPVLIKLD